MSQPTAKPLPDNIRRAIAQAVMFHANPERPIRLEVKSHGNKQMTLTLHEGPFAKVVLRLHKRLHKTFYQIVAAAKKLLATLVAAMTDPLPTPFALLPATCASSRQQPISNAGPLTKREAASATPWKLKHTANMQAKFNAAIGWDAIVAQGASVRSSL